jgi:ubiquinone/menaquinone biosynthesis C-methylase UbiE
MNWHETIDFIRGRSEYAELVEKAYFEKDLKLNIERFGVSEEFKETLRFINHYNPAAKKVLDLGAGNGIASINFASKGYDVFAVEPDVSDTVGSEAIRKMAAEYGLSNIKIYNSFAEELPFEGDFFDVVYVRQAVHHAYDLGKFISECARVLKKGGVLFTVRDHVIYDQQDKQRFLDSHPLHRFYGGENAFTLEEYEGAFRNAGLQEVFKLRQYDSVINYFPLTQQEFLDYPSKVNREFIEKMRVKFGILSRLPGLVWLFRLKNGLFRDSDYFKEQFVPGRLYSFMYRKP